MRMTNLDLNLLKTFVRVAEEKSFTQAGKKLFVEQSSVSKAIKRLEAEIGTQLFLRTKRHVQLTSRGAGLLPIARQVLQSSDELLAFASNQERELSGPLKFGAVSPISFLFMPEVVSEVSRDYPELWPMMFTGMVDDLVERVRDRALEFAILGYEGDRVKELEYREVGQYRFRVVCSSKISHEARNSFIGSREVHDQNSPRLPTFEKLRKINRNLQIKYSANDLMAYRELILQGLGIGLLPDLMVREEVKRKRLKVLYPEIPLVFSIQVVHRGSEPLSLEAQQMIEVLKKRLG